MKIRKFSVLILFIISFIFINNFSYTNNRNINLTSKEKQWLNQNSPIRYSPATKDYPVEFLNKDGIYSGITSDILNWLEKNTEIEFQIAVYKNSYAIKEELKKGNIHLISSNHTNKYDHLESSNTLFSIDYAIIGNEHLIKDSNLYQMTNKKISVIKNSIEYNYLKTNFPTIKLYPVESTIEGLKTVSIKLTDGYIGNIAEIKSTLKDNTVPNLKYINSIDLKSDIKFSTTKDNKILLSILNKYIDAYPEEEKQKIKNKWISPENLNLNPFYSFITKSSGILAFILFLVVGINIVLSYNVKIKTEELKKSNHKLKLLNKTLNKRVHERTSKLRKAILALTKAKDALAENKKMVSLNELILGLSHELNTPIGNIKTIINYMSISSKDFYKKIENNSLTKEDIEEFQNQLNENINLLSASINKTNKLNENLEILKLQNKNNISNTIKLDKLLNELKKYYGFKYRNINMNLNISIDDSLKDFYFPKDQTFYIFKELINNSLFHSYEQEETYDITINILDKNNNIVIFIRDFGKGIPKENIEKIYDPFFTTTRRRGSIGLGLFIVYNIITIIFKGEIIIKNDTPGTLVTIKIPDTNFTD